MNKVWIVIYDDDIGAVYDNEKAARKKCERLNQKENIFPYYAVVIEREVQSK